MDPLPSLESVREKSDREAIEQALSATDGNVTQAAQLLDVCRVHIYRRMRRLGIDYRSFRPVGHPQPGDARS
jgi:transcriptional regulator of acetoin/glycerol metabolism